MNAFNFEAMFETAKGAMVCGDSGQILNQVPDNSVDLILTSPPYALLRAKAYGNAKQADYVDWFLQFVPACHRILKDTGSFVINTGGSWIEGAATRSLYQWRLLLRISDEFNFRLAQDFYWYIPNRNTTTEYACRRKIRARDTVEQIWWLSKTERPKADITRVLFDYSGMAEKMVRHDLEVGLRVEGAFPGRAQKRFSYGRNLDGRLPHNMLCISNSGDMAYFQARKAAGLEPHPARFPELLPLFFISMLTNPGDLVIDPFAGSCTTGYIAEKLGRKWLCIEQIAEYIQGGMLRFACDPQAKKRSPDRSDSAI